MFNSGFAYLEEDRDAQIHERLREVDDTLARVVDRHRADGEISFLRNERRHDDGNTSIKSPDGDAERRFISISSSAARRRFCSATKLSSILSVSTWSRSAGARDYLVTRGSGIADVAIADERNAVPDSMKPPRRKSSACVLLPRYLTASSASARALAGAQREAAVRRDLFPACAAHGKRGYLGWKCAPDREIPCLFFTCTRLCSVSTYDITNFP